MLDREAERSSHKLCIAKDHERTGDCCEARNNAPQRQAICIESEGVADTLAEADAGGTALTRCVVILHHGTSVDELEGLGVELGVRRDFMSDLGQFRVGRGQREVKPARGRRS